MRNRRLILIGITYVAATLSGISKQLEAPELVAIFERAGILPEMLSLLGAGEFVLALALLFPRSRKTAAIMMAALFATCSYLLWPSGGSAVLAFNAVMVPLAVVAGFWRGGLSQKSHRYMGAIPLGATKERR